MSLWIRSQNKEKLINVNCHLCVDYAEYDMDDETELKPAKYGIWGDNVILGIYSTKEKALKVLDMIEKSLTGTITIENIELSKLEILKEELKQKRTISTMPLENLGVFQMPQDDEVK